MIRPSPAQKRDEVVTSNAQAEFFRCQAARHRAEAERERLFARLALGEDASREHERRARHLEAWVAQNEAVAQALEGSVRGHH